MNDPFLESLKPSDAERGPFRTAEPTDEMRLERAREQSFERVRQATAVGIRTERRRQRYVHGVLIALLILSCLALGAVIVMGALGESSWAAWICPATAAVISFGLAVWKNDALYRVWWRPAPDRDDEAAG